jgi:hypothetical protein
MKKGILAVVAATVWIGISEFGRNTFLVHSSWIEHYHKLGLTFPEEPVNGAVWGIWSLAFALSIYFIARRFSLLGTTLLSWWIGFVLMWLSVGNLGVLPFNILPLAVPLSLVEAFVASFIIKRVAATPK